MAHEQVPHDGAQPLGVGSDALGEQRRDDDAGVGDLRGEAPVAADDAEDRRARSPASSSARTMLGETFALGVATADREHEHAVVRPEPRARSHPTNIVSQPSSLVRAVSSDTLSVGAYASNPQILRKSLTAWLAWPAEPPTPRMNSRPPRSRTAARPAAMRSTASVERSTIATVSSR